MRSGPTAARRFRWTSSRSRWRRREEQGIAAVDRRLANQLLDRLPVRMREVLVLRALGMSAEVIGQHLDMTASAVRVTQHRASGKLRRLTTQSDQQEVFDALLSSERQLAVIG
jgi:RNA polymerase sigma factor (sigma-70 family)